MCVAANVGAAVTRFSSERGQRRPALTGVAIALLSAAVAWVVLLGPASPGTRPTAASPSTVSGPLALLASASPERRVEVIIQLRPGVDAADGRALVRSMGGQPGLGLPIINGLSARLTAAAARRLGASPLVHAVSLNAAIRSTTLASPTPGTLATSFDQSTGATRLWNRTTGAGVGVAVIDTGVTGDLPDFQTSQGSSTSRVVASAVVDPDATTADDTYGHGTAVAGLVAGTGGTALRATRSTASMPGPRPTQTSSRSRSPTTPAPRRSSTRSTGSSSRSTTRPTTTSAS